MAYAMLLKRDKASGRYHFRLQIPDNLRPYLGGRWEIKKSLETTNLADAKRRYPVVLEWAQRQLEEARYAYERDRQDDEQEPEDLPSAWLQWHYASHHNGAVGDTRLPPVGLLDPEPPLPLRFVTDTEVDTKSTPLSDLIDWWSAERNPPRKTLLEWTRVVNRLSTFCPGSGPESVTRKQIVDFKDHLLGQGRGPKTVKNHLNVLHALWASAISNERVTRKDNPAHGVRITAKRDPASRRLPYSDEDAKVILQASRKETGARRWVPWLLLFTGARLDEVCQLAKADVRHDPSAGWYIDIHHGAPGEGRRLKNLGSERKVPLHRQVVAEGFVEWAMARPDGTLWPDLKPDTFGSRGGTATKKLGRWVRSLGIDDPRKVLHSARHRFKDVCRSTGEIPKDQHDALTGHSAGDVGSSYGLGYPLSTLRKAVDRIPDLEV
jgi:integrase